MAGVLQALKTLMRTEDSDRDGDDEDDEDLDEEDGSQGHKDGQSVGGSLIGHSQSQVSSHVLLTVFGEVN